MIYKLLHSSFADCRMLGHMLLLNKETEEPRNRERRNRKTENRSRIWSLGI